MTFLTELNRLKEAATKGPWTAVRLPNDNRDDQYYVDDEYEDSIFIEHRSGIPIASRENALLIALLRNHADAIAELVESSEYYANEYRIAEDSGELEHWPGNEIKACKAIHDALAKLEMKP